jgi:hypothetical protein
VRERKERKKRKKTEKKTKESSFFKKVLQRKNFRRRRKEEKSNASREQGSGPSEDRVGENTGTRPTFYYYSFFIPRSFVRFSLSLSLLFSFFCVSVCLRRRCNNNNNNKMRSEKTEISLLSERILKCV